MINKKVLMLVSLLIAIGLWMFVMGNVDPEVSDRVNGIEVEMQGTNSLDDQGLTATLNKPKIVSVTIEGKRSQVKKAKDKSTYQAVNTGKTKRKYTSRSPIKRGV